MMHLLHICGVYTGRRFLRNTISHLLGLATSDLQRPFCIFRDRKHNNCYVQNRCVCPDDQELHFKHIR